MPANLSLSSAKARRARDRAEQAALKLLGFFDVNRDGTISSNDLQAAVQTIFRNFFKAQQRLEESNSLMATVRIWNAEGDLIILFARFASRCFSFLFSEPQKIEKNSLTSLR